MDLVSSLNRRSQFFGAGDAFHVFPITPDSSSREDSEHSIERPHKRPRIAEKDKPPCLRCRILKKKVSHSEYSLSLRQSDDGCGLLQSPDLDFNTVSNTWLIIMQCDSLEQCSHCPMQSFENESDFWKILGCFRARLQDFSHIFCPGKLLLQSCSFHPMLTITPQSIRQINDSNTEISLR